MTKSKDPDPNRRPQNRSKDIAVRLWERVDRSVPDGCWPWTGARLPRGYGCFSFGNKQVRTHRVSYELHYGPIPTGASVLHHCDNPPCVRPDHLFVGTGADNVADMIAKQRGRAPRGEANGQAKLTAVKVAAIRAARGAVTYQALADQYGVSIGTIHNVMHRLVWAVLDEHGPGIVGGRAG